MDMTAMCNYFRDNIRFEKVATDYTLLSRAKSIKITDDDLEYLKERYKIQEAEQKLKQNRNSWGKEEVQPLEWAQAIFEKLDLTAKEDIRKFQLKIENLVNLFKLNFSHIGKRDPCPNQVFQAPEERILNNKGREELSIG